MAVALIIIFAVANSGSSDGETNSSGISDYEPLKVSPTTGLLMLNDGIDTGGHPIGWTETTFE